MTVPYSPEVPVEDLPDTAVAALVEAEGAAQDAVAERLLLILAALWAGFTAYWDGVAVVDFATRVATIVQAAQRRAGGLTEQHLRRQYQRLGIDLPTVPLVDLPPDLRLGADTVQVYQRPVRRLRHLVAEETRAEAEAAVLALQRLQAQATTDLQLARATAAQQVMYRTPEVTTGWRRIIHPELGSVCGLCIAASDRVYRRIERMDLHPACRCTVAPIVRVGGQVRDPGRALNAADLSAIYAAAGNTTESRALSRTRIQVRENGELGPILMADGVEYKGPKKAQNQLSPAAAEQRLLSIQNQLARLKSLDSPNRWYLDRIEQLEELAAAA
jgi:hypothetical protein